MDLITEQQSRDLFDKLIPQEGAILVQFLLQNINQYKASGVKVDFPYWFYSVHKETIFGGEEFPAQYIEPQITSEECTFLTIYYITRALIKRRGSQR